MLQKLRFCRETTCILLFGASTYIRNISFPKYETSLTISFTNFFILVEMRQEYLHTQALKYQILITFKYPTTRFFWWILWRDTVFRFKKTQKLLSPIKAFRGLYLHYLASYGRFTDFRIYITDFSWRICLRYFLKN